MKLNLSKRIRQALDNTDQAPPVPDFGPVKDGDIVVAKVPTSAQGLYVLASELIGDQEALERDQQDEENPDQSMMSVLGTAITSLNSMFWAITTAEVDYNRAKGLALREDWSLVEIEASEPSQTQIEPNGVMIVIGSGLADLLKS